MKIAFIGGGNMAIAIVGGLMQQGYAAAEIGVVEVIAAARERWAEQFKVQVFAQPTAALLAAPLLVLAVKPQQLADVAASIAGKLTNQLVISIAAGIRSTDLSRWLNGYQNIVRVMPNTPALVLAGISGLYAMPGVSAEDRAHAESILGAVGETVWVEQESDIDAVTAVSGSGPAYVFYFIEALEQAARDVGLNAATARQLAIATFTGASKLAAQSSEDAATLRARVTSKGGTTERALASMEADKIKAAISRAVTAAAERSRELGDELGRS